MPDRTCSVVGCDADAKCKGWCWLHFGRWRRNGDPELRLRHDNAGKACAVDDCDEPADKARGLCGKHYQRWRIHGDPTVRLYRDDGRVIMSTGYVHVRCPGHPMASKNGYASEHRKVVYDAGIEIPEGHQVHHKNGIKDDNRLENLEVIHIADHTRLHHLGRRKK